MKKTIVISAINLRDGGTLSILNDCLSYLQKDLSHSYNIVALVHKKEITVEANNITFIEFPNSINSYAYRLYYEYVYFKKLSKQLKPYLWLSLHDMTPNVYSEVQAVYCHNPTPFYKVNIKEATLDIKFAMFSLLYKYLYKVNIKKNDYVIVQQEWLAKKFKNIYKINNLIVSNPDIILEYHLDANIINSKLQFIYPSFPRVFKNFEVICDAVELLNHRGNTEKFEVILTIDGTENAYSRTIYNKYKHLENIKFIGLQSRHQIFQLYSQSDCLLFPSKLETWGLPITEFKAFEKPIIVADLPYSHETVGNYDKVVFFDPNSASQLADYMDDFLSNQLTFEQHIYISKENSLMSQSWEDLFKILL